MYRLCVFFVATIMTIWLPGMAGSSSPVCFDEYKPVCGSDSITYKNACEAQVAGVFSYVAGECIDGDGDENDQDDRSFDGLFADDYDLRSTQSLFLIDLMNSLF